MAEMPCTLAAHYRMFGRYNAWANGRLLATVGRLSVEQYRADRGAFFKSVHGTLNHLLVTDRIWMQRFTGEGEAPNRLAAILYETFDELRLAREAEDRRIIDFVDGLDEARIASTIKYRRVSSPQPLEQQLSPALAHWFNHQTHHRGQVHGLLTGLAGEAPELDLLIFQRLVA
ncbi:MAG TPA: DinB family protein [Bradyrhizobium sp.]|nr:DinB family protein [Bradyrhizobium sp.]